MKTVNLGFHTKNVDENVKTGEYIAYYDEKMVFHDFSLKNLLKHVKKRGFTVEMIVIAQKS